MLTSVNGECDMQGATKPQLIQYSLHRLQQLPYTLPATDLQAQPG